MEDKLILNNIIIHYYSKPKGPSQFLLATTFGLNKPAQKRKPTNRYDPKKVYKQDIIFTEWQAAAEVVDPTLDFPSFQSQPLPPPLNQVNMLTPPSRPWPTL